MLRIRRSTPVALRPPVLPGLVILGMCAFPLWASGQSSSATKQAQRLVKSARSQIGITLTYDGSYKRLKYPGGDVEPSTGVCSDVVVRAYRDIGIDLQKRVHEDMRRKFSAYPSKSYWGLKKPDRNIDHRRVLNLQAFLQRQGARLKKGTRPRPGDLITWNVAAGRPHIGIVSNNVNASGVHLIIHNIGSGTQEEDVMHDFPQTGHYRFFPPQRASR